MLRDPPPSAITADPTNPTSGPLDPIALKLSATTSASLTLQATGNGQVSPPTLALTPGAPRDVTRAHAHAGRRPAHGRRRGNRVVASMPWLRPPAGSADVPLGALRLTKNGRGVRFTLGAFRRGDR